ncbi:hypothetical protein GCM10010346_60740 [Streptomyces chryseus]|uniref:Uncharacterized protein n=1 Tax=Streptomyces chryseus TaxID=68186 RepID=A0ABQ3EAY9_9ACTN|nr:hypothetical protein GCM10010346_60740 [Streptomyces chryseus]
MVRCCVSGAQLAPQMWQRPAEPTHLPRWCGTISLGVTVATWQHSTFVNIMLTESPQYRYAAPSTPPATDRPPPRTKPDNPPNSPQRTADRDAIPGR